MTSYLPFVAVQNPWAFAALMSVVVPLVLHFISKSQATLIKFANIKLIEPLQPKNMRQIRLTEFWLLLVRLLLLAVSILLLAQVIIAKPLISNEEVVAVSSDWLNHSSEPERQQILADSFGKPMYLLSENTRLITPDEIKQWQTRDENEEKLQRQNILLQITSFSELLTPETNIKLFVTDRANQYEFSHEWRAVTIRNKLDWQIKNIAFSHQKQFNKSMKVVIVYDQDRSLDVKYFQQAFMLLKQEVAAKLDLSHFLNADLENNALYQQALNEQPAWLFYLSSQHIDQGIVDTIVGGTNVFVDANNAKTNLMLANVLNIDKDSNDLLTSELSFYQRALPLDITILLESNAMAVRDEVLWQFTNQNGVTLPMLTRSIINSVHNQDSHIYQLYSRFSPSWSNLLVTKQFPIFLKNLLFEQWRNKQFVAQRTLPSEKIIQQVGRVDTGALENLAFNRMKKLIVQQRGNVDFWTEILMTLVIFLWVLERIASELSLTKKQPNQKSQQIETISKNVIPAMKSTEAVD
jgi:hypothetical protein